MFRTAPEKYYNGGLPAGNLFKLQGMSFNIIQLSGDGEGFWHFNWLGEGKTYFNWGGGGNKNSSVMWARTIFSGIDLIFLSTLLYLLMSQKDNYGWLCSYDDAKFVLRVLKMSNRCWLGSDQLIFRGGGLGMVYGFTNIYFFMKIQNNIFIIAQTKLIFCEVWMMFLVKNWPFYSWFQCKHDIACIWDGILYHFINFTKV